MTEFVWTNLVWAGFFLLIFLILAFDLGIFSRESKTLTAKTALFRTGVYFFLSVLFAGFRLFQLTEYHWFDLGVLPVDADLMPVLICPIRESKRRSSSSADICSNSRSALITFL